MENVTYTISEVNKDQGCVRVEMSTPDGHELHQDVYADLASEEAVLAAVEEVAAKFAADVVGKVPTNLPKPPLDIEKLVGQVREVAVELPSEA